MIGMDTTGETVKSFFANPEHVQSLEAKSTGGQLLQVKPKDSQPQGALALSGTDASETIPGTVLAELMVEKKEKTPAATSPAVEKKAETPAADKKPDSQQAPGQAKK